MSLASDTANNRPTLINSVRLKDVLGEINTDNNNRHGSAPHTRPASYLRDRVSGVHPFAYGMTAGESLSRDNDQREQVTEELGGHPIHRARERMIVPRNLVQPSLERITTAVMRLVAPRR